MPKTSRCEDPEVQAIIESGTQSAEWVAQEFANTDLSDKRLDRRLIKTAEHLAKSPASPINEACGDWASTQAAYRLFDNSKATPAAILKPHIQATVKRMVAHGGPVLVLQDTVFFSYGQHVKTKGLGPIGKSNSASERGLIMHNALAFTTSGVPLGLPVRHFEEAVEKVQWYGRRWGIETWHKVLKSGCKVEDCMLEEALRLKRYLTLFSIIGVRLMHVAHLARAQPDMPATEVFSAVEIQVLHLRLKKALPTLEHPATLRDTVRMLGRLGGHLGRTCDGEPGVVVLWRGWMRLYESVEMLHSMQSSGLIETR